MEAPEIKWHNPQGRRLRVALSSLPQYVLPLSEAESPALLEELYRLRRALAWLSGNAERKIDRIFADNALRGKIQLDDEEKKKV